MNVNDIETLYNRLKEERKIRNWSEFAKPTKYSRTHISEVVNGSKPLTPELIEAIETAWVQPTLFVGSPVDFKDHSHLREKFEMLKEHHTDIKEILKTNLASLSTMQLVILAEIKAGLEWEVRKAAKGDKKKELQTRGELSMLVGENLRAFGVGDKNFEMGKLDK